MKRIVLLMLVVLCNLITLYSYSIDNIDIEFGLNSYVGGKYIPSLEEKNLEYKEYHDWSLLVKQEVSDNMIAEADIRYFPEMFDKRVYLYSSKFIYTHKQLNIGWEFGRVGYGDDSFIYRYRVNSNRYDRNFITDYRFNGGSIEYMFSGSSSISLKVGGNDLNTAVANLEYNHKLNAMDNSLSILVTSRDNRYNCETVELTYQGEVNTSFIEFNQTNNYALMNYESSRTEKHPRVFKNFTEFSLQVLKEVKPAFSIYYEVENWSIKEKYEVNGLIELVFGANYLIPGYEWYKYNGYEQDNYYFIYKHDLTNNWNIGFSAQYIKPSIGEESYVYGIQTSLNILNNR